MKLLLYILIPLVLLVLAVIGLSSIMNPKTEEISYKCEFDNLYVKDDKVYIDCWLKAENNTHSEISFNVYANLQKEYESGLLKEPVVYAVDSEHSKRAFKLSEGWGSKRFEVTFLGNYGGTPPKNHTVNLSDINFEIIEE